MGCAAAMRKKLVKHGNSRALVIDKAILELMQIGDNDEVIVSTDGTSLLIRAASDAEARRARLDSALDRINARYPDTLDRLAK